MEALSIPRENNSIQWKQLWSLAALYGSIVIGWIAYQNYQPKLLEKFNFTDFSFPLMVFQGIILVVTPPIAGRLGDRYRFKQGHRIPIITTGISFAAMVFMAVAFTLFSNPGEIFKWILPVLIVFWLIAMSIFTSPALSTIELFSPVDKLPRAMAILTIVANLIYAIEPVIVDIIDYIGAPLTFITGGTVVFISGYALKKNSLSLLKLKDNKESDRPLAAITLDTQKSRFVYIFFLGLALGLPTTIMFNIFPDVLSAKLGDALSGMSGKVMLVNILLLSALISLPMSSLVNRLEIVEVSLPHTEYGIAAYYVIAPCEASSNLARYDGVHFGHRTADAVHDIIELFSKSREEGFGPEVKRRIMIGTYALSSGYYDAYYNRALKVRTRIAQDFEKAFEKCDVILSPTSPFPAFKIGEKSGDPLAMYLCDVFTVTSNIAGNCSISIPCGFTAGEQPLPIGLQLIGPAFGEEKLLQAARMYEQVTEWHKRRPVLEARQPPLTA